MSSLASRDVLRLGIVSRRRFIEKAALVFLANASIADAQPVAKTSRIGFLHPGAPTGLDISGYLELFRQELRELGFVEGQNLTIDYRWGYGDDKRLPNWHLSSFGSTWP